MRLPIASLLASLPILCGCVTAPAYERHLDSFVGKTEDDLVRAFGPPRAVATLSDGGRVLEWGSEGSTSLQVPTTVQHQGVVGGVPYSGYSTSATPQTISLRCITTFTTTPDHRVVDWRWQGNNCVAPQEKPEGTL